MLHEDLKVREFLKKKLAHASVGRVVIERPAKNARITVYSARPGVVIGKKGEDIEALKRDLQKMMGVPVHVNIEEMRKPEIDAKLIADSIAQQLEKRIMFRRAMKRAMQNAMRLGAQGIKIMSLGSPERHRDRSYRVVSRRPRAAAHPACGHRLRYVRSQDHLRHHRYQGVGVQG
jgi:small subunit ribosomal protein S3